jgi:dipeptidyl aminopeptidase/acylaminoacyl peptidase
VVLRERDDVTPPHRSTFQPLTADCVIVRTTPSELSLLSLSDGSLRRLTTPPDHLFSHIRVASSNLVLCVVSGLTSAARLVTFNPQAEEIRFETLKLTSKHSVDDGYISKPREIAFQAGPDPGQANSVEAYAWLYEPANKDHEGPEGAKPPLIIKCHGALRCYPPEDLVKGRIGGPTTSSSPALDWCAAVLASPENYLRYVHRTTQFWTSRGFMLADVNYGGSTGKGRAYRDRLRGNWGIVDVEDSAACVRHLVKEGLVDPKRVLIMGRSAGASRARIHFASWSCLTSHRRVHCLGLAGRALRPLRRWRLDLWYRLADCPRRAHA